MTNIIVVDLSFGDAGKGTTVDYLCATRKVESVVRFNGGPQAAHNVVRPDGTNHIFSQFGSGTFHGVPTLLSRFMAVDPLRLAAEALGLRHAGVHEPLDLLNIDSECIVVTPYHQLAQRCREREIQRNGSCGTGFGEAVAYARQNPGEALRVKHLGHPSTHGRLERIRDRVFDEFGARETEVPSVWDLAETYNDCAARILQVDGDAYLDRVTRAGNVVFEGSQGVLLDEDWGFHPYTTWSRTTPVNALELLDGRTAVKLGVLRAFTTRHGPGPFPTEAEVHLPDPHNFNNEWQGEFRVGHFDAVAHRYAVDKCGGIDALVVTHLDRCEDMSLYSGHYYDVTQDRTIGTLVAPDPQDFEARELFTKSMDNYRPSYSVWPDKGETVGIAYELKVPVMIESRGPTWHDKKELLDIIPGNDYSVRR